MYQGKDRYTYFSDKPYFEDNRYLVRTLDDNQHKDLPDILVNMCKFHCRNVHWGHKVMMHMDQLLLIQL